MPDVFERFFRSKNLLAQPLCRCRFAPNTRVNCTSHNRCADAVWPQILGQIVPRTTVVRVRMDMCFMVLLSIITRPSTPCTTVVWVLIKTCFYSRTCLHIHCVVVLFPCCARPNVPRSTCDLMPLCCSTLMSLPLCRLLLLLIVPYVVAASWEGLQS